MTFFSFFRLMILFFLSLLLGGCEPNHIHEPAKVKSVAQSSKITLDRNAFVLCTATKTKASVQWAENEAKKECARFGKYAQKQKVTLATCPLTTPVSFHYQCVNP